MYSGIEAGEEMVEPFSQSLSPFWELTLPGELRLAGEWERLRQRGPHREG